MLEAHARPLRAEPLHETATMTAADADIDSLFVAVAAELKIMMFDVARHARDLVCDADVLMTAAANADMLAFRRIDDAIASTTLAEAAAARLLVIDEKSANITLTAADRALVAIDDANVTKMIDAALDACRVTPADGLVAEANVLKTTELVAETKATLRSVAAVFRTTCAELANSNDARNVSIPSISAVLNPPAGE